jgi:hypothetical protein
MLIKDIKYIIDCYILLMPHLKKPHKHWNVGATVCTYVQILHLSIDFENLYFLFHILLLTTLLCVLYVMREKLVWAREYAAYRSSEGVGVLYGPNHRKQSPEGSR